MSLISEYEVIISADLGTDFAPSWLTNVIIDCEENFMENCFGWDFYQVLLEDKIEYEQYDQYDSDITYASTNYAMYEGRIFKSQIDSNLGRPINDETFWVQVPKFTTELYEALWNRYLMRLIAMECSLPASTYSTFSATKAGIVKRSDIETGTTAASRGELGVWKDQVRAQIERATRAMIRWVNRETEKDTYSDEFRLVSFVKSIDNCGKKSVKRIGKRRFFFRR